MKLMKAMLPLVLLILDSTAKADCPVYFRVNTVMKEAEKTLTIDTLETQLKAKGFAPVSSLARASGIVQLSFAPVRIEQGFSYRSTVEHEDTLGRKTLTHGLSLKLGESIRDAVQKLPDCQD
jgi:hypothetical protein